MPSNNLDSGDNPGLPALMAHVSNLQTMAYQIEALLLAISAFQEVEDTSERVSLVDIATRVSKDLGRGLDNATLHEVML